MKNWKYEEKEKQNEAIPGMVTLDSDEHGERQKLEFDGVKRVRLREESRGDRMVEGDKQFRWKKRNKRVNEFDRLVMKHGKERKLKMKHSWASKRPRNQAEAIESTSDLEGEICQGHELLLLN